MGSVRNRPASRTRLCDHGHRVTGGWLSAAIAARPLVSRCRNRGNRHGDPRYSVVVHRRRRARRHGSRQTIPAWPDVAENAGLAGSRIILSAAGDAWGWTARVLLRKGSTAEDAIAKIPAIESGLGVRPRQRPGHSRRARAPTGSRCGSSRKTRTPRLSRGPG